MRDLGMRRGSVSGPVRTAACVAGLVMAVVSSGAMAEDWPHLRGPHYDGRSAETGIVESWPPAGEGGGPPVLWQTELGQGYSAIIAVSDRLYTQKQSLAGQFVVCLDAETGRRIWRRPPGFLMPWAPLRETLQTKANGLNWSTTTIA